MAKKKKSRGRRLRTKRFSYNGPGAKGLRAARRARARAARGGRKHPVRGHLRKVPGKRRRVRVRAHRSYEAAEKKTKRTRRRKKTASCVPPKRRYRRRKPYSRKTILAACPPKRRRRRSSSKRRRSPSRRRTSGRSKVYYYYYGGRPKRRTAAQIRAWRAAARRADRADPGMRKTGKYGPSVRWPPPPSSQKATYTPPSHQLAAEGGRRRKKRRGMKSNPVRHHRRRHYRGAMENPLSGMELVTGGISGLFGFLAADLVDRFVATHALTTTANKDAAGHVLYADTPPTTGTYTGLFNGTAVVAPMYVSWQRWLFPGLVAVLPIWGARYVRSNTARATVQMFGVGAGIRWLGKALTDGVATLLSYTCTGQRLYDPEIRGHALRKVNGNANDPSVTGFPTTGLGRRVAPAGLTAGPPAPQLSAGVGKCGKCGKTGVGACCGAIVSCCPPAPQQAQNPAPPIPNTVPNPPAPAPAQPPQVQGPPRSTNPYKWGHDEDRDAA